MSYGYLWWIAHPEEGIYASIGNSGNVIYVNSKLKNILSFESDTHRIMDVTARFLQLIESIDTFLLFQGEQKGCIDMKELKTEISKIKRNGKKNLLEGITLILLFCIWTYMVQNIDVQSVGVNESDIGFATINTWFHNLTGVHMWIYTVTDWLGLVPVFICIVFAGLGFVQLIKRRSLLKVDADILVLGVYYILVIFGYLIFEMIPINYRPILIDGFMEASYPSSTTLLVLSVMSTLIFQVNRRMTGGISRQIIIILAYTFMILMVFGRLVAGVHWLTDIVGSVLLSLGLYFIYIGIAMFVDSCQEKGR